jgi:hypothetical protein
MDICITGIKRWEGISTWMKKQNVKLFNEGFEKLVRYWQTCLGGVWSWLCGEVYTGDKGAHIKTYFHVSLFLIKTKVIKIEALLSRNTNKMQPCNRIYYSTVHWRLNMFRAAYRSSSGALNCICSLWFTYACRDRP